MKTETQEILQQRIRALEKEKRALEAENSAFLKAFRAISRGCLTSQTMWVSKSKTASGD